MRSCFVYKRLKSGILQALVLTCCLSACSDFLNVVSKDQISDATLWETTGNADLFLNNVYAGLPGPFQTDDPWENFTDNTMNGLNYPFSRQVFANASYTPNNAPGYWGLYNQIRKSNLFIERVNASELPAEWKTVRLAESRFLRAYYYMLLWTHHGGVPLIEEVLNQTTQGEAVFRPRNSYAETFQFIVDECEAIAMDLPLTAEKNRATRGAALALKGWCELFDASPLNNPSGEATRWAAAAETYGRIIAGGAYELFPDYETLFFEENNGNQEVIFAKAYVGGTSLGGSREGLQGPRNAGGTPKSYGGVNPTQELVDEYVMENGLPIEDANSTYDPQNPYLNREKRFYQSIVFDGATWLDETILFRTGVGSMNEIDLSDNNGNSNTGYSMRKGLNPKYAVHGSNGLNSADFIIFRYAEVLLGYAEARNEAEGPDASVYQALNKVRERSELPPLPANLSKADMRKIIHRERRVELAFEEKRWSDLLRLKLAETNLNSTLHAMVITEENGSWVYKVAPAAGGSRVFLADRNYYFPVPQEAINRNSKLTQNPNY